MKTMYFDAAALAENNERANGHGSTFNRRPVFYLTDANGVVVGKGAVAMIVGATNSNVVLRGIDGGGARLSSGIPRAVEGCPFALTLDDSALVAFDPIL